MSETRLYKVTDKTGKEVDRLVDAGNPSQAIRHCVNGRYDASPAKPKDVSSMMSLGIRVEKAGEEPEPAA